MKTLIIHPTDPSTWFLNILYAPLVRSGRATLLTEGSREQVRDLMKTHDRVMMMGHGAPDGLFCVGQFSGTGGYIVERSMVPLLRQKKDSVFIWCHADRYVRKHDLDGFSCGMFISEVGEARFCGVPEATQPMVDESNFLFMHEAAKAIMGTAAELHEQVTKGAYGDLARTNPVAKYNHDRLQLFNPDFPEWAQDDFEGPLPPFL